MRICYFGTYEKEYPRNRNLINGLRINGVKIIELHESVFAGLENKINIKFHAKIVIVVKMIRAYLKLIYKKFTLPKIDCVIVGYIGQLDMLLAKILFPTKKIIFNPMLSLYDTMINDRQISNNYFIKKTFYLLDKISCSLANKIILDTPEHARYFHEKFNIPKHKLDFVYIGADEKTFYPIQKKQDNKIFKVLFYGKFTPIHGIEHIIKAAKLLEDENIIFEIIGTGQMHNKILKLARDLEVKHINFIDWVDFKKLPEKISQADICLGGHFGKSKKVSRVVANKVFQMIAVGKPVIISDSPATASAGFVDYQNALFCSPCKPEVLSKKIMELKNNLNLRKKLSQGAYQLFREKYSVSKIGEGIKSIIHSETNNVWNDSMAYRLRKKIIFNNHINNLSTAKYFLDIGVGGGNLCLDLAKRGFCGEGIDISPEAITIARLKTKKYTKQIFLHYQDIFKKKEINKYDMIFAFEVLEHIKNDYDAVKKIYALLHESGYFIFSVPAHKKRWSILDEWAGHYRRYEKSDVIKILQNCNFSIEKVYNYGFPLINILRFMQKKIVTRESIAASRRKNTEKSGIDRQHGKKFKFLFNDGIILFFYYLQKFFVNFSLSPALLIVAKKCKLK